MTRRRAFTIIELLVVIAILGILMSLLMPSLMGMREMGRRAQCQNNLKQMSTAFHLHVASHGFFPTGGWGYFWVGDPDGGFGIHQPGGWLYNILPYLDYQAIHDLGKVSNTMTELTPEQWQLKKQKFCQRAQIAIPLYHCPSRRRATTYPFTSPTYNYDPPPQAARSDYAANGGSVSATTAIPKGTPTDDFLFQKAAALENALRYGSNGIHFCLSRITPAHLRDGASCTYMLAEKHVAPDRYTTGTDAGDNESLFIGDDQDISRWTYRPPLRDTSEPVYDNNNVRIATSHLFGSAHATGFHAALCDGSVRMVGYSIDPTIHCWLGTRDGIGHLDPLTKIEELPLDQSQIP